MSLFTAGISGRSSCFFPSSLIAERFRYPKSRWKSSTVKMCMAEERGIKFLVGECFYKEESRTGRDLGVLMAALHKANTGSLRVLDAMCGSGVRVLRYLLQSNADFVWANDANEQHGNTILGNLSQIGGGQRWFVSHRDANKVLAERYIENDLYDFIDIDSFGSESSFLGSAFSAAKYGGLLYLTSTDGFSSGGHRPDNALASYGSYIRPMPYCNEIGLRMLIGGALREAATRDMDIWPIFSYYSYHGPVFRAMLTVKRGRPLINRHYGFVSYCNRCGHSRAFLWKDLNKMVCNHCEDKKSGSLVISGPLWIGPLHSGTAICQMIELAEEWGWTTLEKGPSLKENTHLKKLLDLMLEESNTTLPVGYIKLDEEGYAASRSHIATNAIKTSCPMTTCIKLVSMHQNFSKSTISSLHNR